MRKLTGIKNVSRTGHSLAIFMTKELALLGIKEGETVMVTIERVRDDE